MPRTPPSRWASRSERFWAAVLDRRPAAGRAPLALTALEDRVVPTGRPLPLPFVFVGAGSGAPPTVKAYHADTGVLAFERTPFSPDFTGGVRVAAGDVDHDGLPDLVCAAGPGGGPRVVVYSGKDGSVLRDFFAYDPAFTGGVSVAAGDVNGDGVADVITAAGAGGGPHVKAFSGKDGSLLANFFAFAPDFRGGATVAAADFTGDGKADLVVGAGPGGGPHVKVFDVGTGKAVPGPVGSFFAFAPDFRGGVEVGTDALAGDVTGDGKPDVVVGRGAGAGSLVRVFDGVTAKVALEFSPFGAGVTAGVRVATAFVDDDAYADVIVGTGAGPASTVKVFGGKTGVELAAPMSPYAPFGAGHSGGVYVAGSNDPPKASTYFVDGPEVSPLVVGQTVAWRTGIGKVTDHPTPTGTISFFDGVSGTFLGSGTLQAAADGNAYTGIVTTAVSPTADGLNEGMRYAYSGDADYYAITGSDGVGLGGGLLPRGGTCSALTSAGAGATPGPGGATAGGVGVDGSLTVNRGDLSGQTGNIPGSQGWSWANNLVPGSSGGGGGSGGSGGAGGTRTAGLGLSLAKLNGNPTAWGVNGSSVVLMDQGNPGVFFDKYFTNWAAPETPVFRPRYGGPFRLTEDPANGLIVVADGRGNTFTFWDFGAGNVSAGLAGQFKAMAAPGGATTAVTSSDGSGRPTELRTTVGSGPAAVTESFVTDYAANTVTERRQVGSGAWATVRSVASTDAAGQLKTAVVRDAAGAALETSYYRYYGGGYAPGGLKYAFGPAAYARLTADLGTGVDALTDAQVAPYADTYLEYDGSNRVTKRVAAGEGCSACSGGQGTYTYAYSKRAEPFARLPNAWALKTVETLPDGNQNTYYASGSNAILVRVYKDAATGQEWVWAYQYDATRRVVLAASPSAVSGYSEALDDLVGYAGGTTYLRPAAGLLTVYAYGTGGAPAGYLSETSLLQGTGGTPVKQETRTYTLAGDGKTYVPAAVTAYRNADGTGAEATTLAYAWQGATAQAATATTTLPAVTAAQNGPGISAAASTAYDAFGRATWTKDAAGVLTYAAYDPATGAVVTSIRDVNTTLTADFTGLPAGWTTPAGGGLHLKATSEVDALGRTTTATDPLGHLTYTVYNDANHEVRTYAGWDATANAPTGPTAVSRDDRPGGYAESLTMSAAPHLTAGRPDGTEAVGGVQSLSRAYRNTAGQTVSSDAYFNLTGLAYTTSTTLGVAGTNFDRTTQDFDKQGRPNRTRSAAGTITRTYSDGQGRAVSQWVGTNDTPATGFWSPANPAGMTEVREFEYDGGGVGDGTRTKATDFPGGAAAARVTQTWFDWRDRPVAVKAGVEATESATVNRPISYADYDNLGQVVTTRVYDGDAVTVTTTAGVPVAPAAGLLRAQSATAIDELGRAYQTRTFSVDPATGAVGTAALTQSVWFDLRGLTLKTLAPGGLVRKTAYDSLGRATTTYATDGGGDPAPGAAGGWAAAGDVTGDAVLSQSETAYDANGNVTLSTRRDRFHDETATGALGTPTVAPKARVSYSATYYDPADRTTDAVEVGTNGGVAYVRPAAVPARSDTALVSSVSYDAAGRAFEATDPRGLKSRTTYDARGRTLKTVENYVDGVPSNLDDKTTEYAYGPAGMTSLTARLTGGGGQTTQWVYGVTTATGSGVNSNDAKGATRWPDPATGAASAAQQETMTVNALGQPLTSTDRNGTTHAVAYDVLGRATDDAVTLLGVNVDGAVRRVHTDYDGQGNASLLTNYSAATGGTVVSQVQRAFNGLGQLTAEYQAHGAAVDTATTLKIQYAYSALDATNRSRPVSVTYPNGRVVASDYGTPGQLNDTISRLSTLTDGATTLEAYAYLGLGTVVTRSHPQPGIDLTYVKRTGEASGDAGDQYIGTDRFGRVVDQRWVLAATGVAADRFGYTYDRDGNRLTRSSGVNAAFGEAYTYDGLNQVASFARGAHTQAWAYDALGNWNGVTTDGTTQTRTANAQNEITAINGATTPTYDANGNMTTDETGRQFAYDAWNRLKVVKSSGGVVLETLGYDALNRRITATAATTTDLYYSANWQVLEERVGGVAKASYVWSPVYVDALVSRDRDADGVAANGLEERLYALADANSNVTGLVSVAGVVVERYAYDPFGAATVLDAGFAVKSGGTGYGWVVLFQGLRRDGVSGLDYARNRDYSAALGRWVTMDPIRFVAKGKNLYAGELNNPLIHLDPQGTDIIILTKADGAFGHGHMAVLIGSDKPPGTGWKLFSFFPDSEVGAAKNACTPSLMKREEKDLNTLAEAKAATGIFTKYARYSTTTTQDAAAVSEGDNWDNGKRPYCVTTSNCVDMATAAARAGGVKVVTRKIGDTEVADSHSNGSGFAARCCRLAYNSYQLPWVPLGITGYIYLRLISSPRATYDGILHPPQGADVTEAETGDWK